MPLHLKAGGRLFAAKRVCAGFGISLALLLAGCGKPAAPTNTAPAKPSAATKADTSAAATDTNIVTARPAQFMAVFSTNETRDPFNPKAKPKTPENVAVTAATREAEAQ